MKYAYGKQGFQVSHECCIDIYSVLEKTDHYVENLETGDIKLSEVEKFLFNLRTPAFVHMSNP